MRCRESSAAWRLFEINWVPLGLMAAGLTAGAFHLGFSLHIAAGLVSFAFVATYAGVAYYNARAPHRGDPQVVFVLGATAQIVLATVLAAPLTYVAAGAKAPLLDPTLLTIDRALGLDWHAYLDFVNARPLLASWLSYGYSMIKWPIFAIPVILCAARRYVRLQEFALAFTLALGATALVSAFTPAMGVFYALGLDPADFHNVQPAAYLAQLRDLSLVRDGGLRELNIFELAGIVTFPSFHAASAALYTWALWPVRWMRPVAVAANAMMLAATPIDGGHYFIDLAAGIAVAMLAVCAARLIGNRLARGMLARTDTPPQPAFAQPPLRRQ
ncbi:MAG: phosphatase PAP2 family protein [Variibacter sp.]|nr:phosphatase PAP2 family protein [Variibacter sp.]